MNRLFLVALALLLVLPSAAAMQATELTMGGNLNASPVGAGMASLVGAAPSEPFTRDGGVLAFRLEAASAVSTTWATSGVEFDNTRQRTRVEAPMDPEATSYPADGRPDAIRLEFVDADTSHFVNVFPIDGNIQLASSALELEVGRDGTCIDDGGYTVQAECTAKAHEARAPSRVATTVDHQFLATDVAGMLTITGSFIIESVGIDLVADDGALIRGRADSDGGQAGTFSTYFTRIHVDEGTLTIDFSERMYLAALFAQEFQAEVDGTLRAIGLTGAVPAMNGNVMSGHFLVTTATLNDLLDVEFSEANSVSAATAATTSPLTSTGWVWPLLLIPAALAVIVARNRAVASMPSIEAALAAGDYRSASRLSARVLKREPGLVSAELSRAIALVRANRHAKAVDRIRVFLASHAAPDGTFHYLLGLALAQLGRTNEARKAMEQAVFRTPELIDQVAPELQPVRHQGAYT
jgi:hypothetical protein